MAISVWTSDNTLSASGPYLLTAADLNQLRPPRSSGQQHQEGTTDPPNRAISVRPSKHTRLHAVRLVRFPPNRGGIGYKE